MWCILLNQQDIKIIIISTALVLSGVIAYSTINPTYDYTVYQVDSVQDLGDIYQIEAGKILTAEGEKVQGDIPFSHRMISVHFQVSKESFDFVPEHGDYIKIQGKVILGRRNIVSIEKINYNDSVFSLPILD